MIEREKERERDWLILGGKVKAPSFLRKINISLIYSFHSFSFLMLLVQSIILYHLHCFVIPFTSLSICTLDPSKPLSISAVILEWKCDHHLSCLKHIVLKIKSTIIKMPLHYLIPTLLFPPLFFTFRKINYIRIIY